MSLTKTLLFFIPLCLLSNSCWKQQNHAVTRPETPVYTLSGIVRDIDSKETLSGVKVFLDSVDKFTLTDSTGKYQFIKKVTVKDHGLTVERNGYKVFEKTIVMNYSDRNLDLEIPKVLTGTIAAYFVSEKKSGIYWNNNTLLILEYFKPTEKNPFHYMSIYTGKDADNFKIHSNINETLSEDFSANGLVYCRGSYWFLMAGNFKSVLYEINSAGKLNTKITLPFYVADITWDGNNFWVTSGRSKIIKLVNWGYQTENYFVAGSGTHGIAWDGKYFWTTDINKNYICKYDSSFSIIATYKPFIDKKSFEQTNIAQLTHIAFDLNGNLWGVDSFVNTRFIFKFEL